MLGISGTTITYLDQSNSHYIWTVDVGDGHPVFPQVTLFYTTADCSGTAYAASGYSLPTQLLVAPNPGSFGNAFPFPYYARDPSDTTGTTVSFQSQKGASCAPVTSGGVSYRMIVAGQMTQFSVANAPLTFH